MLLSLITYTGVCDPLTADLAAAIEALDGTLVALSGAESLAAEEERVGRLVKRIKGAKMQGSAKLLRESTVKGTKGESLHLFLFADCAGAYIRRCINDSD